MRVITILSLPRSGTSLAAQIIGCMGASLPDDCIPPHPSLNPDGFFESAALLSIRIELERILNLNFAFPLAWSEPQWSTVLMTPRVEMLLERAKNYFVALKAKGIKSFVFKDPRTSALLPFWTEVFARAGTQVHYVLAVRSPDATARSISHFNGHSHRMGQLLWLESLSRAFASVSGRRFSLIVYEKWFTGGEYMAQVAQSVLGGNLTEDVTQYIDREVLKPGLNRNGEGVADNDKVSKFASDLYDKISCLPVSNVRVGRKLLRQLNEFCDLLSLVGGIVAPNNLEKLLDFDRRSELMEKTIGALQDQVQSLLLENQGLVCQPNENSTPQNVWPVLSHG